MCTAFTHAVVALAAGRACFPGRMPWRFWLLAPVCSAIPDADVALHTFGVQHGDLWGHRGMTHSLLFALVLALAVVSCFFRDDARWFSARWWALAGFFFAITASHGIIDAFTDGGPGIAFFAPFLKSRHFMPWRPIPVPPIGLPGLFTPHGWHVLRFEMLFLWVPVGLVCLVVYLARRQRYHDAAPSTSVAMRR